MILSVINDFDRFTFRYLHGGDPDATLTWVMIVITVLGGGWSMIGLVPFLMWRRTRRAAGALTLVLLMTAALVVALKELFGRVRPWRSASGIQALWESPTDYSFPSGHATGSFAFAGFVVTAVLLLRLPRRTATIAISFAVVFAVMVGISRIYLGVHFPSDVLASVVLGTALGSAGARFTWSRGWLPFPNRSLDGASGSID